MKKGIYLSLVCSVCLNAAEVELESINVATKVDTEVVKDVSGEDIKSADLGEALFKQSASVSLVRRSGVANDIILRGQKKDNINITIDGAKVYGACPNRMDPPVSHVLTNNVDYIEINEGPFNVEEFGSLSGDVKIHTVKPEEEFAGELNVGLGSWGYQKGAFSLSGGITDNVRVLLSGSTEKSEQYEDGDGNDFAEQMEEAGVSNMTRYQPAYKDMDAYTKKTFMAKLFWDITDNQELRLSYTANRSDDVLYPSSGMDALYDDSDIYNIEYIAKDLGTYSKELNLKLFQSEVDHPMSNKYRNSANNMETTHALTTKMQGAKLKNSFDVDNHTITAGLDYSIRNWDGAYIGMGSWSGTKSIDDVDTKNYAFFLKDEIKMDKLTLDIGLRYDDTKITSQNPNTTQQPDNDYNELNGYIFGTYQANESTQYFAGFGKSSRVPDARELYFIQMMMMSMPPSFPMVGTSDLENTVNYEFDLGVEKKYENATIKAKAFYSKLDDFIAYNANNMMHSFENVDATIYGFDLSGTYVATDALYFDYGMSYQRGEKENALSGQSDTDMPEIPPFKLNLAVNYDYDDSLALRAEIVASDEWSDFDSDNGEQELDGYAVLNLKGTKQFGKNFELTVGIDNVFDETYAVSNTYKDLTLLTAGGGDVMLLNEPGRYFYTNIKYKF
ncbi:TonB-dependent receptor [Sulfurovum sp. AR]|uniref:TonB-dependent receptor n=1 Tax=Sulfurovum sp. AR TaxID=1165841 RepID=UPI00025C4E20|nr:TonB-dependent receptor [Sulfurovum sp. AR]EIF50619.1 TonB-dependent copper receptor [Sulfurovum sp. AR]